MSWWNFVYNLGISGGTTDGLLERFELEAGQRMKTGQETILIFATGGNDCLWLKSTGRLQTPLPQFKKKLQKLVLLAKKKANKVVFVGSTPVDETKTTPILWAPDKFSYNKNRKEYDEAKKAVCEKNGVLFIDVFESFSKPGFEKLLKDGMHPDSRGHKKIFEIVKNELYKNKVLA